MSGFHDELVRDFPDQFEQIRGACECGPGWSGIIRNVCQNLAGKGVKWACVKEKFGCLRMYAEALPETLHDQAGELVDQAYDLSSVTCEDCGDRGTLRTDRGWWRTLCDKCHGPKGNE